ncbi:PH domain-containing protein [Flavobacterium piscinae]|uniref:PH domain-containing protein n=1 Tax=Flavobacterium piscinae TaxID=2506424 RepID=UPI0013E9713F|nr:PH domain-containing protein [Flavobacterium piscinae]
MEEFTNSTVSFDALPKVESVSFQPLNKNYLNVVYLSNAIFSVVLAVGLTFFILFNDFVRENVIIWIALLVGTIALQFWLSTVSFRKKGYALREKDILFRKGILSTTTTVIPFNRIQHVALHEGVFSRMYQLTELQVYTAGGSSSDLHIPGLPKEEAERIKSFLLNKITVLENVSSVIEESIVSEGVKEEIQAAIHMIEENPSDSENEIQP